MSIGDEQSLPVLLCAATTALLDWFHAACQLHFTCTLLSKKKYTEAQKQNRALTHKSKSMAYDDMKEIVTQQSERQLARKSK